MVMDLYENILNKEYPMRKLILFLFLFIGLNAQELTKQEFLHNSDKEFYFEGNSLDSGTVTSSYFDLTDYNGNSFISYPLSYVYQADTVSGQAIFSLILEKKFTKHDAIAIDTIVVSDTASTGLVSGTIDFNNSKAPQYRIKVVASSALGTTFNLKLTLFAYKEE